MLRTRLLPLLFLVSSAAIACSVQKDDNLEGCPSSETPDAASLADAGTDATSRVDSATGDASDNPDPASFLPIPDAENTFRVVMEGQAWDGYDRSCTELGSDSHHSIGFGDTYMQATDSCAQANGHLALVKVYRSEGLAAGVYDITPDGNVRSKVGIQPPGLPSGESDLTGRLWIRSVTVNAEDTVLEASFYGTAMWAANVDDASPTQQVTARVAVKARIRNTDVP